MNPRVSIIVPTLDEAGSIGDLLADLGTLALPKEVIVVDGGSTDDTAAIAQSAGARVLRAEPNRGRQLLTGARAASGPILCFLHADTRLDARAVGALEEVCRDVPSRPAAFRLRINGASSVYRLIEAGANARSRLLGLPYGDQGLVIGADLYWRAGGHPPRRLMEDVDLARALRGIAKIRLLPAAIDVSARRWERDGPLRRTLRNQRLLVRHLTGTPAEHLAASYDRLPDGDPIGR